MQIFKTIQLILLCIRDIWRGGVATPGAGDQRHDPPALPPPTGKQKLRRGVFPLTSRVYKTQTNCVRVINRKAIREFGKIHADSVPSLSSWFQITRKAKCQNFAELRADFGSADQVGRRTVFNIGGNKYRLIARVNYRSQRLFILHIMKHVKYVKGEWK